MNLRRTGEKVLSTLNDSVGYQESDNKKEFMKGAGVAVSWMINELKPELKQLINQSYSLKTQKEQIENDIFILSSIIRKYRGE